MRPSIFIDFTEAIIGKDTEGVKLHRLKSFQLQPTIAGRNSRNFQFLHNLRFKRRFHIHCVLRCERYRNSIGGNGHYWNGRQMMFLYFTISRNSTQCAAHTETVL